MAQHFRLSNEFVARGGSEKQTPSASQYNTIGHFSLNSPEHVLNETFLRPYIGFRSFEILSNLSEMFADWVKPCQFLSNHTRKVASGARGFLM